MPVEPGQRFAGVHDQNLRNLVCPKINKEYTKNKDVTLLREFSRFVTNELSNPLTAISSYTEMCQEILTAGYIDRTHENKHADNASGVSLKELLQLISDNTDRLSELLVSLQKSLDRSETKTQIIHVEDVVREVAASLSKECFDAGVTVDIEEHPPRAPVLVDPVRLGQVFTSTMKNSINNMIKHNPHRKRRCLNIYFNKVTDSQGHGKAIVVNFRDSGPRYSSRIIRPFIDYETNEVMVEMSAARTVMESFGGDLDITTADKGVTEIQCLLPICKVLPEKFAELKKNWPLIYT